MRSHALLVQAFTVALLAGAAHADVLVVKAAGGGDFTDIAPAVAAAQAGDLILVHPAAAGGSYGPFTIDGKSLTVSAAHATDVVVTRVVAIRNLGAGQSVLLRGLTVEPKSSGMPLDLAAGVELTDCDGAVRLDSCTLTGGTNLTNEPGGFPGVLVLGSDDVGLENCTVHGGAGWTSPFASASGTDGGHGLLLADARVWVHESQLAGGMGGHNDSRDIPPTTPVGVGDGGAGVVLGDLSTLTLAASGLTGGSGGVQAVGLTQSAGGHGLQMLGPDSDAHARSTTLAGGAGTGTNGMPLDLQGGFLEFLNVASRHLQATSPLREGGTEQFLITGQASDVAWLLVSLEPHGAWVPKFKGPVLVGTPALGFALPLGTVPPNGQLPVSTLLPDLGPGLEHVDVHVQLVILSDDGTTLENGSSITLLDAAF